MFQWKQLISFCRVCSACCDYNDMELRKVLFAQIRLTILKYLSVALFSDWSLIITLFLTHPELVGDNLKVKTNYRCGFKNILHYSAFQCHAMPNSQNDIFRKDGVRV